MSFAKPDFQPGEVRRAGEILRNPVSSEPEIQFASEVLKRWRAVHLYPLNTFQATLRRRIKSIGSDVVVGQRLKRSPSVIAKLRSRPTMRLQQMQDIAGLRAISGSLSKHEKLKKAYQGGYLKHECIAIDDYIEAPKIDGYRSSHLIYKYKNSNAPEYDDLHVELQLRTKLQHAWATAVETVDIFMRQSIKAGNATPEWARFFKAASAAFAKIEGVGDVPGYENCSLGEVVGELREAEAVLNVLNRISGFRVATDAIMRRDNARNRFLHLIVLDHDEMRLRFSSYGEADQDRANDDYTKAEARVRAGDNIDPVLVAGGSLKQLKRSYPNYFADNHFFIERVVKLIRPGVKVLPIK